MFGNNPSDNHPKVIFAVPFPFMETTAHSVASAESMLTESLETMTCSDEEIDFQLEVLKICLS